MSTRWLPLAMLLASGSAAIAGTGAAPIVGGETVPAGRWPDTVAVLGTGGSCTGTLIAPDLVLTAGHCAKINPVRVVANTTDYAQPEGIKVNVTRTTAYPNWQTMYDIAVVEGASPRSRSELHVRSGGASQRECSPRRLRSYKHRRHAGEHATARSDGRG